MEVHYNIESSENALLIGTLPDSTGNHKIIRGNEEQQIDSRFVNNIDTNKSYYYYISLFTQNMA